MKLLLLISPLLLFFPGFSQENQLRFEKYDFRQGLSNPAVNCIYQDKAGFLWIGTAFGLNRYDGARFENYFHEQGQPNSLIHNTVHSIAEDKQRLLWIGTDEGISCFNPRTNRFINQFPAVKGFDRFDKTGCIVYNDRENNIWIGSAKGIAVLDAARSSLKEIHADLDPGNSSMQGYAVGFAEDNEFIWAATSNGMFRIHKKTFIAEHLGKEGDPVYHTKLLRISKDAAGRIWTCNWRGQVFWYDPSDSQLHYRTIDNVSIMDAVAVQEEGKEYIYISTFKGLAKMLLNDFFAGNSFSYFLPDGKNPFSINHRMLSDIYQDRNHNIWIGSEAGLNKIDPLSAHFTVYPYGQFNTDFPMQSMCTTDLPDEYYVLTGRHAFRLHRQKGIMKAIYFGDKYECYDLFKTGNIYWMTINGGLLELDKELQVKAHYQLPHGQGAIENRFRWMLQQDDGSLWISTARTGIVRFDINKKSLQRIFYDNTSALNLHGNYVEQMVTDAMGRTWIGTSGGLYIYDHKKNDARKIDLCQITNYVKNCENVVDLYQHKDKMYICTKSGLYAYDLRTNDIRHIPLRGPGISQLINSVMADHKDRLWMNTNNGLVVYDQATGKTILFGQKNGLPYQDLWSPMYRFNNEIFTGASSFMLCFHPDKLKGDSLVPAPVFSSVLMNDTSFVENSSDIFLRWNSSIAFNFISIQFNNSVTTQYAYQLDGLDKAWHAISSNTSLRFSNLPAGKYSLRVKAINSEGVESAPAIFAFGVRPPFWKTWWFISLVVIAVSAIVYAIYRYRIYQAVRLERMRIRIATDLHDDIGATLSSISMYSDAVKKQVKTALPHLEPVLNKMGENSRNMVSSMSDIVWAINPGNDEGEKLLERMENYGKDNCSIKNILFSFYADKKINAISLPLEQRKNIYLIFKEAINNALKYAEASEIRVKMSAEGKKLAMSVTDNGKGFDEKNVKKGNGLENMQQRAREIGGVLTIHSGKEGTAIDLAADV